MRALAIATVLVFGAIGSVVGWYAYQGDPMGGEPTVQVELGDPGDLGIAGEVPRAAPAASAVQAPRRTASAEDRFQPPPGLSVIGIDPAVLPPPPPGALPAPGAAPSPTAAAAPSAPAPAPPLPPEPARLGPVPVEALVQDSRYGPLPRIAPDGRQPSEIYARPTRYASLPQVGEPARIAVLINGLGLSETVTADAIARLPAPVTLAFGPYGRNLQSWVSKAREAGHEVMLQIPLEPFDYPDKDPGPHTLLTNLPPEENLKRLHWVMARFTGYAGVTNHMGAKFAAAQDAFLPILEELKSRGLIYVDDGVTARSTAARIARDMGLGFSVAQLSIDASPDPAEIDQALARLEASARQSGLAIAVGSGLPVTIDRVAEWAAGLADRGFVLVPVSAAVRAQHSS